MTKMIEISFMTTKKDQPEHRINIALGSLHARVKKKCIDLGVTLQEAAIQAFTLWLKEKKGPKE